MSHSAARARTGRGRTSLYQEITDKIIAELEAGRVPWVQPWATLAAKASLVMPKNAATQRPYSGINVLILWGAAIERGFGTQNWLTFRHALGLGGNVRKGEHGTTIVYADRFTPDEERRRAERDGDEPTTIPFLKRFTVFNTDQCENLPGELTTAPAPVPEGSCRKPRRSSLRPAPTSASAAIAPSTAPTMISSRSRGLTPISNLSTGTGPPCMSLVIGRALRTDSVVISPAASGPRSMRMRS
jgi:antirestriction protein ArdC